MVEIKKIILDTAEHHPYHKNWLQLAETVAKQVNAELEIKHEDYVFAIQHGVTDDIGMAGLPQLMVELEDGRIVSLLHEVPLNAKYQPDFEGAKRLVLEKLKQLVEG